MAAMCRVDLAGPIPVAQLTMIQSRFDDVALRNAAGGTVLECRVADQSAARALLNLLWDVGSEICSFRVIAGPTRPESAVKTTADGSKTNRRFI